MDSLIDMMTFLLSACYYVVWVKTSNLTDAGTRNPVKIRFSSGTKHGPWALLKHANIREFKAGR